MFLSVELQPLQLLRVVLLLELELALQPGLAPESVPVQLQQQVLDSLTERWTMSSIVSLNTTPEGAIVIYTASSLALNNEPHPYLQKLAGALQLPAGVVKSVHDQTTEQLSCQRI